MGEAVKPGGRPPSLTVIFFLGLFLIALVSAALVFFAPFSGEAFPGRRPPVRGDVFRRGLRDYDNLFAKNRPGENPDLFIRSLDRLEKNSLGVESQLSLLKRRRALARMDRRFQGSYRERALEAAENFPHAESLAVIAVDALLAGFPAGQAAWGLSPEDEGALRSLVSRIYEGRFSPLVLGVRVLLGDLESSDRAAALPGMEDLLAAALTSPGGIPPEDMEGLLIDAAALKALRGDGPGAAVYINALLSPENAYGGGGADLLRFAGEFFYDYGNPLRSAELFSLLAGRPSPGGNAWALSRTADALWLADRRGGARNIWTVLAAPRTGGTQGNPSGALRNRALYNLAASEENPREGLSRLEELFAAGREGPPWYEDPLNAEAAYVYGVIRYTRLLDGSRALAILDTGPLALHPLLDLEILRRRLELVSVKRAVAETWLLLGRHPKHGGLYEWAAWYFDRQRQYQELALLVRAASSREALPAEAGYWLELHQSLSLMREGKLEEAEARLRSLAAIPGAAPYWQASANLGRILEARHSPAAALECYETAAARAADRVEASRLQYRISRCLRLLGREHESRRVLEYALDLNPDNLNARLELHRLDSRQIF